MDRVDYKNRLIYNFILFSDQPLRFFDGEYKTVASLASVRITTL